MAMLVARPDGRLVHVNADACRLLGYSEEQLLTASVHEVLSWPTRQWSDAWRELRELGSVSFESTQRRTDGGVFPVELAISHVGLQGAEYACILVRDTYTQLAVEAKLREAQRMKAIGELASGVAHDFNNVLGIVLAYCGLLHADLGSDHPGRGRLERIQAEAENAARLTRQLLALSRKPALQPRPLDLGSVVKELEPILRRLLGDAVELSVATADCLGLVKADLAEVEQILVNLVANARDAMPKGGQLRIETANVDLGDSQARPFVMLAVADSGMGMDSATQQRVFEPYFTTKAPGEGTGLGLAAVQEIVKRSGGFIGIHSVPGIGSTFKVYLPLCDARALPVVVPAKAQPRARGAETLLVVEDTEVLREMFCEVLKPEGYTVLGAGDGQEALRVAREYAGPIHLLLTDVILPRLGGVDLAHELKRVRPEVRVLYMSGYPQGVAGQQRGLSETAALIEKPFTTDSLCLAVRQALDRPVRDKVAL